MTTTPHRWLGRLTKQLTHEVIIDRYTINQMPAFEGGARRLDKVLGDQLDSVLGALNDELWVAESGQRQHGARDSSPTRPKCVE